jgi:hypothetical protein
MLSNLVEFICALNFEDCSSNVCLRNTSFRCWENVGYVYRRICEKYQLNCFRKFVWAEEELGAHLSNPSNYWELSLGR